LTGVRDATAVLDRALIILATVLMCGLAGWLLLGIRHTDHDDLYFDLLAHDPNISWWAAAWWVAALQQRLSHLLNVPLSLVGLWLLDLPVIGDIVNLSQLAVIIGGILLLLRRLVGGVAACGWAILLANGFALHWYYTPPTGYPLIGLGSLTLLVLSLVCTVRFAYGAGRGWLWLAALLSTLGIVWPEFNFLLFPVVIGGAILLLRDQARARFRLALAFLPLWGVAALACLAFRVVMPIQEADGRLTVGLDPLAWAAAFGILMGKAILPIAMFIGVDFNLPSLPGMPNIPHRLDYGTLAYVIGGDPVGFIFVFLAWWGTFLLVLRKLAPRRLGLWFMLAVGLALMVVPSGVLALSSLYQRRLIQGITQGHIATAYIQLGFLTSVFAVSALLALRWQRMPLQAGLALALAGISVLTLSYNLVSRDGMSANLQRWKAFDLLVETLPDGAAISVPNLWQVAAVSVIPGGLPFGMSNYWTERALLWHNKHVAVRGPDSAPAPNELYASYGVRPEGLPILLVRDTAGAYLLADAPLAVDRALTGGAQWRCERYCRLDLPSIPDTAAEAKLLASPTPRSDQSLFAWLVLPRSGAFAW
jgi:hypothetical protein